jgi:hypothetical protein
MNRADLILKARIELHSELLAEILTIRTVSVLLAVVKQDGRVVLSTEYYSVERTSYRLFGSNAHCRCSVLLAKSTRTDDCGPSNGSCRESFEKAANPSLALGLVQRAVPNEGRRLVFEWFETISYHRLD